MYNKLLSSHRDYSHNYLSPHLKQHQQFWMIQQGNKQQVICYMIWDPTLPLPACDCIPSFSPRWVYFAPHHVFRNQKRSCPEIWILWAPHVALYSVLVLSTKAKNKEKLHAWHAYQTKSTILYRPNLQHFVTKDADGNQIKSAKWKL